MSGGKYLDPYGFSKGGFGSGGLVPSGSKSLGLKPSRGYINPYGWGSGGIAGGPATAAMRSKGGGGGALGWLGSKLSKAGHDIVAMPTGIVHAGEAVAHDSAKLSSMLPGGGSPSARRMGAGPWETPGVAKQMAKGTYESLRHPLRDPFQTLLSIGAVAAPGAGAVARVGAASDAAAAAGDVGTFGKAAEVGKALIRKPLMPTRELHVPTIVKDETGALRVEHHPVHLVESHAPLARAAQALHDRILQRSLEANLTAERPSLVARYAASRVGKATGEEARIALHTRNLVNQSLAGVRSFDKGLPKGHGQLALFLRSANVLPHEAADFWNEQAAAGVNPAQTLRLARWAQDIHGRGVLHVGEDGRVAVNAEHFPMLNGADKLVQANQAAREAIIGEHNLMSPEGMAARKSLVAETMRSEAARNAETGVREGQGYTPLSVSEKSLPPSPVARGRSPIIPQAKPFSLSHEATGEGVRTGLIPDNTTRGVAQSAAQALRYLGSVEHRGLVYRYGSDVRRTGHDVLVADPEAQRLGEIPLEVKQLLGREHSTLNTLPANEEAGLAAAMKAKLEDAIPSRASEQAKRLEEQAAIGTAAPTGYRWVPKQMLGELVHETLPRTKIGKAVNDLNSAVTAATVYFKLGHIPQRFTTNATTSLLAGALDPANFRAAIKLRKALSQQEYGELAASTGTHAYQALPAEGVSKVARIAQRGAGFYAHRIDSPFRFLNLVNEARAAGINDATAMRDLIKAAKNPGEATPRQLSVLKRANRVSMMYDGLGPIEKRYIARGVWFYPWVKASVRYAGHTIAEHPLKAALGGQLGALGEQQQAEGFGGLPYYEYGLTPLGRSESMNLNPLSAFGTAADVLQTPEHLNDVRGNLNPVSSAAIDLLTGTNGFGVPQSRGKAALGDLTAPTPEAQILAGYLNRHKDQSRKMFPNSGGLYGMESPLLRALFGSETPRRVNKDALERALEQWRTIHIPVNR